jgi:heptosyltransferase I
MVFMRIAIVKLSALGDIVHAMVVLQFIKKFNQEISIDWFVEEGFKDLLEFHPDINKVHLIKMKQASKKKSLFALFTVFKKLRKLSSYDLVIDMQGLIKSAIISKLIPSSQTLGFDKFSVREGPASFFYNKKFACDYDKNIIQRNIELVEFAIGFRVSKKHIQNKDPFLFSKNEQFDINLSSTKKNILLIPGASHKSKHYPTTKLAELSTLINANFVVIWGNSKEEKLAIKIKELSPRVNISPKISLNSLVLLISSVDLVIGPDTGPTHFSWALNIPSITLFGSTPGYRNTYQTKINRIIESSSHVNPKKINKADLSIKDIDVSEISIVAKQLLR